MHLLQARVDIAVICTVVGPQRETTLSTWKADLATKEQALKLAAVEVPLLPFTLMTHCLPFLTAL